MDKAAAVGVFTLLNTEFALKYSDAWVKKLKTDPEMPLNWVEAIMRDSVDSTLAMAVINRVKSNERYADYPPNLNAFLFECSQIRHGNILDHDTAYITFCSGKKIDDLESRFLVEQAVASIGAFRLKSTPFLFNSFNSLYDSLKTKLISGELKDEYLEFCKNVEEKPKLKNDDNLRKVEDKASVLERINKISSLIKNQ